MYRRRKIPSKLTLRPLACLFALLGALPAWAAPASGSSSLTAAAASFEPGNAPLTRTPLRLAAKADAADSLLSRDALFGDDDSPPKAESKLERSLSSGSGVKGVVQFEAARTTESPVHWSKMLTRADLSSQGNLGNGIKWKLGARIDYDAVFGLNDYYSGEVAKDQRFNASLRENYLDISADQWDFRLGRQHVVWGEMVGLFFADVVSARNLREFILPEFDMLRIPQWAARAEYFKDDFHAELLWIPVASYDEIGKPGAEFFPFAATAVPGVTTRFRNENRPSRQLANSNYGLRLSSLSNGWDFSGFFYSSMDVAPTFYRETVISPQPAFIYEARHDRIRQLGGTLAKDFGSVVLKGESVYTRGRRFNVLSLADTDGVVSQNTLDWALGLDFTLPAETRLNLQVFQRDIFAPDPDIASDKHENGYSVLLNHKLTDKLEAQALWIASTNRTDWLFRPRVTWAFERNWRLAVGADVFKGPPLGLFGRFDGQDRVYSELRYSF